MRKRRSLPIILIVALIAAAVALVVTLRKHAPPEPARLLPSADAFVYVNLQWMRRADVAGHLPAVPHDPDYERFIQATGFQFERDLDQAAFAVHYPGAAPGKQPELNQSRFSEVFVGKMQGERLSAYLKSLSKTVDSYRSVDIYNIPLEGRTLRAAILGVDMVAASNQDDPTVIRGIIDRSRKLASPFGGPALLRKYYKEVPFTSLAWGIFNVQNSGQAVPAEALGLPLLFSKPAVIVSSVSYLGSVRFKAEAFTGTDDDAKLLSEQMGSFLDIFHSAETSVQQPASDPDLKEFLDSLKVEQHKSRAVLTAVVPTALLEKMVAESPAELSPAPPPAPAPAAPAPAKKSGAKRRLPKSSQ